MSKLPHLERVELVGSAVSDFKITGEDIKLIGKAPSLNTLILWGVEIEENAFNYLPKKNFWEISLVNLRMKESDLNFLRKMNIYSLGIRDISVNPEFIKDLKSCKGIEFIDIKGINHNNIPWKEETVKKLSREFPDATVDSSYGIFKNGSEQKNQSK